MGRDFMVLFDTSKLPSKSMVEHIFRASMAETLNTVLQKVYDDSQTLVPVNTGALRDSGVLAPASEFALDAYIQYGNSMVDYALKVHEDLEMPHTPPTQAKYLEVPLTRHQPELIPLLVHNLEKHWNMAGLSSTFSLGQFTEQLGQAFGE